MSGDKESGLVNQYVRGFISLHRDYYLALASLDARYRGLSSEKWVDIILAKGMKGMPDYQEQPNGDEFPKNPLSHIIAPAGDDKVMRSLNFITLGAHNFAFLHVGIFYDQGGIAGYVSRIIREHIIRRWDTSYVPQIEAAKSKKWF